MKTSQLEKYLLSFSIILIISYGFYLCFIGGYGSDEDTLPMIYVFEVKLGDGRFVSSRFTGYPIPEIGLGFLAYFFGSFAANSVTFLFHLVGLFLIFFSFYEKINIEKLKIFLILCLSSPVLFFENLEPIDYSWAFLFFSIGAFFYSRKVFELAILAFAFAVGCRINFLIFAIIFILFFDFRENIDIKKKLIICFSVFIVGGLFYLPVWFHNSFNLSWITAARPTEQGFFGLLARFSFKSWSAIGYLQIFLILYGFKNLNIISNNHTKSLTVLIISNLLLFLYIPAELSYLQPAIIFLYLIVIQRFKKSLIISLVVLNFVNWGINLQVLSITYKDNSICGSKQAIDASIELKITSGAIYNYFESREMIKCWVNEETERGQRIIKGKSIKIYK
ncbi:hypothetical protein N8841_03950 [Candidatus Pelagibacter sp.]|nr:hypothetical protein [Candidatus Pelagibacter sp.]